MRLSTEIRAAVVALLCLHVITAFGAIALFSRMSPAIELIIRENALSVEAVGEMLAVLAVPPLEGDSRARFEAALERARANVTETEEPQVIDAIERRWQAHTSGDGAALPQLVAELRRLEDINREAMRRQDERAKRIGSTGAWAAVFLAALTFGFSLIVLGRFRRRIVEPMNELRATLAAAFAGDPHRRCRDDGAPGELRTVLESVNTLLDERRREAGVEEEGGGE